MKRASFSSQVRDGKIVTVRLFGSEADALKALGQPEQAMAHEKVEIVRRFYEGSHEIERVVMEGDDVADHPWLALWHPECVLQELAEVPDAATYHGRDGVVSWMQRLSELFNGFRFTPVEIIEGRDGVFVAANNWGKSKVGVEVEGRIYQVLRVRDGMIIYATGYSDRNRALKAVGLAK